VVYAATGTSSSTHQGSGQGLLVSTEGSTGPRSIVAGNRCRA
jgi:hypothetical protein